MPSSKKLKLMRLDMQARSTSEVTAAQRRHKKMAKKAKKEAAAKADLKAAKKAAKKAATQCRKTKRKRPSEDLLMKLPGELRNRIYELVLPSNQTIPISTSPKAKAVGGGPRWREPSLLGVSKAIRSETVKMYYQCNQFDFTTYSSGMGEIYRFLRLKSNSDDHSIRIPWTVRVIAPNLRDLADWLPFAKAVYRTADEYQAFYDAVRNPLTRGQGYSTGTNALLEVSKLAMKARQRNQTSAQLVQDFVDWASVKINMSSELKKNGGLDVARKLFQLTGLNNAEEWFMGQL